MTKKETIALLKATIDKAILTRLRPIVLTKVFNNPKKGLEVQLNIPAYINIDIDEKFQISQGTLTYTIKNSKVCVTVYKDETVHSHITVY